MSKVVLVICRGCVERPTIWWMNRTLARLPSVPSLAFVHVPVPEFMEVWTPPCLVHCQVQTCMGSVLLFPMQGLAKSVGAGCCHDAIF